MMTSLFSSFDPSTPWGTALNWLIIPLELIWIPSMIFLSPFPLSSSFNKLTNHFLSEFKKIMSNHAQPGNLNLLLSLFLFILSANILGLFPFIFTSSSHLMITLVFSLSLWFTFMLFQIHKQPLQLMAHLVPSGSPMNLAPFMVLIETISNCIRPLTLAVRLSANMIAGHLLMTLLGNSFFSFSPNMWMILTPTQMALLMLESAVALIQAYVFTLLITLYSMEI